MSLSSEQVLDEPKLNLTYLCSTTAAFCLRLPLNLKLLIVAFRYRLYEIDPYMPLRRGVRGHTVY